MDVKKAAHSIGAALTPVGRDELQRQFEAQYGTVTPLLMAHYTNVRQIVDQTVMSRFYSPYTMMTNCGDLRHGVEFRPEELFDAVPNAAVDDIVVDADRRVPRQSLGILTGNSPESGILLWEKINERIRTDTRVRFRGDTGFPRVLVDSVPGMGGTMELSLREPEVRSIVLEAVSGLCRAGATVVGVACNTTQYFAREIEATCANHAAQFVSVAEETGAYLRRSHIKTFDLLGIGSVTDLNGWSDFGRALDSFDVRLPKPSQIDAITKLAFQVKKEVVTPATINHFRDLITRSTQTDTIVVALTELSVLLSRHNARPRSGKRLIDTLDLLASRMADIYLEERINTGGS